MHAVDEKPAAEVDFEAGPSWAVHYWRKHPDLHGWMRALYYAKGGTDQQFNCVNVMLSRGADTLGMGRPSRRAIEPLPTYWLESVRIANFGIWG